MGITMVRDEADIIESTVRYMLEQTDGVVVSDNGSKDGTLDILRGLRSGGLTLMHDREVAYYQGRKMTALAAEAAARGADWVIPFDADEVWYWPHGTLRDALEQFSEQDCAVVEAETYTHIATALDPAGSPPERMGWRVREPVSLPKVACRCALPCEIAQGNHDATYPAERGSGLVVRHYPYRSAEQMILKTRNGASAYAATDLPEWIGQHWREHNRLSDDELRAAYELWFCSADPENNPALVFDPVGACLTPSLS